MCGGKQQEVVQRVELDPALQRVLYGGTLANPRTRASDASAAAAFVDKARNSMADMRGYGGGLSDGPSDGPSYGGGGYSDNAGVAGGGDFGGGGNGGFGDGMGIGGVYANGGMVSPQQGIGSLNRGQMPMPNGQMPNLSDPMVAAALAMAMRQPELQYGPIMASQQQMPMQQPMAPRPPMPMQQPSGFNMGGYVEGPGTGRSDDIEAQIYQNGRPVQEARLSDGEFVMTERAVRGAGGGNREEGAAKMYRMMQQFERGGRV